MLRGFSFSQDSRVMDTHYNEKNVLFTVTNLFAAGTDTSASTLRWGLLLMAKYPHLQGKIKYLCFTCGCLEMPFSSQRNLFVC